MQSESLRRLDSLPKARPSGPVISHEELSRQVDEFLARGGEIEHIPSSFSKNLPPVFNDTPIIDPVSRKTLAVPMRELVDGRWLVNLTRVTTILGVSKPWVSARRREKAFPEPVVKKPQMRWDEEEILRFKADNQAALSRGMGGHNARALG